MEAIWLEWKGEGWDTPEDNGPCEDCIEGGGTRLQQCENKENLRNLNIGTWAETPKIKTETHSNVIKWVKPTEEDEGH